jgi:hypothetical protein
VFFFEVPAPGVEMSRVGEESHFTSDAIIDLGGDSESEISMSLDQLSSELKETISRMIKVIPLSFG